MIVDFTDETFIMYAIRHYDNPACKGMEEFNSDLKRLRYLTRLFKKYEQGKGLRERLILNHIIVFYNLFGSEAATKMLFYKIDKEYWCLLKTFLVFLNVMPSGFIAMSKNHAVPGYEISIDNDVLRILHDRSSE